MRDLLVGLLGMLMAGVTSMRPPKVESTTRGVLGIYSAGFVFTNMGLGAVRYKRWVGALASFHFP